MRRRMTKYEIDPAAPSAVTAVQRGELEALGVEPESKIDYSDIPPLTDAFWRHAERNPFPRPSKTSTTVRIDSDVLLWLRAQGKGYQSRINAILRREMLAALRMASGKRAG